MKNYVQAAQKLMPVDQETAFYVLLGSRMKYFRENRGYDQKGMSEMLGVSQSSYSRMECGETKPTVFCLLKFCDLLSISGQFSELLP